MNVKQIVLLSLTLVLVLPSMLIAAGPGVHYFDCSECHISGFGINELGAANICLTCHGGTPASTTLNPGAPQGTGTAVSGAGFDPSDASNQYLNNPSPGDETSHHWAATNNNPAAGAAEPVRANYPKMYSRYGATTGTVACSRCHDPHGQYADNPKLMPLSSDFVTPMQPNDLCLACHKAFGDSTQADHGFLSHPMLDAANVAALSGTANYYNMVALPEYNPADPYSNGVQLVNGQITCLTCHGLHFTDSNDATADGPAGAAASGDGLMLRDKGMQFTTNINGTDYPDQRTAELCNTCHKYDSHLHGAGDNVGCMACHGGHNADLGTPNYYMLKDPSGSYATLPSNATEKSAAWGGSQAGVIDGLCESCHGDIETDWNAVRDHSANFPGEDCTPCHTDHSSGSFSEPLGCDGCHGSPPSADAPGNAAFGGGYDPNGYAWVDAGYNYSASGVLKDESTTPHSTHSGATSNYGYQCRVCHNTHINNFATTHNIDNSSFQDVLESGAGDVFDSRSDAPDAATPAYNNGDPIGNCSNVYCHSNGGVNDGAGNRTYSYNDPDWADNSQASGYKGSIVGTGGYCSACHGNSSGAMGSATHDAHLDAGYDCNICHVSTATNSTDLVGALNSPPATHINEAVDIAFDNGVAIKSGGLAVAHGTTPYSNATNMTCSAVYCHSSGQSVAGDRNYQTITWTTAGPLACTSCHNVPSASQTAAHAAHVNGSTSNVGRNLDCAVCHDDTMNAGNNSAVADASFHVNGKVDVKLPVGLDAAQNCGTALCHSDGNFDSVQAGDQGVQFNVPAWTLADTTPGTLNNCVNCHGDGATKSYPSYASKGTASTPTGDSNSHETHVGGGISCEECHSSTTSNGTSITGATHVNQNVEVTGTKIDSYTVATETCSATACHGAGSPQWGGTVVCGSCHAADKTIEGSHSVHYNVASAGKYNVATIGSTTDEYIFQCGVCHSSTSGASPISHGGGAVDGNSTAEVNFDGTVANGTYAQGGSSSVDSTTSFDYTNAQCSNLYCHGNFTGNGNNATAVWGDPVSGACGTCHDVDTSASLSGGSHDKHVKNAGLTCDYCHAGTAVNAAGGIADRTLHVNQLLNWKLDATKDELTASSTYDSANAGTRAKAQVGNAGNYSQCDNIYCHSTVQSVPPAGLTGVTFKTPTWGGSAPCGSCHKGDAVGVEQDTASHTIHVDQGKYAKACSTCHQGAGSGSSAHADYSVDVVIDGTWGGTYDGSAAPGDAYGGCASTYCHSDGQGNYSNPTWNTSLDCQGCHDGAVAGTGLSGAHAEHFNGATLQTIGQALSCEDCHSAVVDSATNVISYSLHVNTAKNFDSCAANLCHTDGNIDIVPAASITYYNANQLWADGTTLDCDGCHGDGAGNAYPTYADGGSAVNGDSNSHNAHLNGGTNAITCVDCHAGTSTAGTSIDGSVPAQHVDGTINVDIDSSQSPSGAYNTGTEGCTNITCHGDGLGTVPASSLASWGGSLNCSNCHTEPLNLGAHAVHLVDTGGSCTECHKGAVFADDPGGVLPVEHSDGNIDVYNSAVGDLGYPPNVALGGTTWTNTCNAASCHDDGTGTLVTTPAWNQTSACAECHKNDMVTVSHDQHLNTAIFRNVTLSCDQCHGNTAKGVSAITDGEGTHRDGSVDVYNSIAGDFGSSYASAVPADGSSDGTCATTYCHGDTLKFSGEDTIDNVDNVDTTPTWGQSLIAAGNGCDFCHGYPPVGDTGSGAQHPTSADCSSCHQHTDAGDLSFADSTKHIDGIVQIDGGDSCLDCHGSGKYKDPTVAEPDHLDHTNVAFFLDGKTIPNGDYGDENPTGTNNLGWYDVVYNAGSLVAGCGQCHPQAQASHPSGGAAEIDLNPAGETMLAASNPKKHNNASSSYSSRHAAGTGKCSNVYCHGDGVVAPTYADSPSWDTTADNLNCASCHGNSPSTNAHGVHEVGIHYEELYDDDGVGLMAKSTDDISQPDGSGGNYGLGAAHGDNNMSTTINCFTCHSGTVLDSANAGNTTCNSCHNPAGGSAVTGDEVARIATNSTAHLNGQPDVVFGALDQFRSKAQLRNDLSAADDGSNILSDLWRRLTTNSYKAADGSSYDQYNSATTAYTPATKTCSTASCHNGIDVAWNKEGDIDPGNYAPDCTACHTSLPK